MRSFFSTNNKKRCHELMVRIYYPTRFKTDDGSAYYQPLIRSEQEMLSKIPVVKLENINKLYEIKSHTVESAPVISKKFPVVLFMSGLGGIAQMYENLITELVSHGYVVIGIMYPLFMVPLLYPITGW
ncbi:TPA: hypothetical protein ACXYK5_003073 [Legionella pneumophila]